MPHESDLALLEGIMGCLERIADAAGRIEALATGRRSRLVEAIGFDRPRQAAQSLANIPAAWSSAVGVPVSPRTTV